MTASRAVETTPIITEPLTLITPLDSTTTILSWTAHPEAVMYRVIFSRAGQTVLRVRVNPMMCVDEICTLDLTAHPRTSGLQSGVRYRWRVVAILTGGVTRESAFGTRFSLSQQTRPTFTPGVDPCRPRCPTPTPLPTQVIGSGQIRIGFDGADSPYVRLHGDIEAEQAFSLPHALKSGDGGRDGANRQVQKAEISIDLPDGAVVKRFSMQIAPFPNGGGAAVYFFERPSRCVGAVPILSHFGLTPNVWNEWNGTPNRPFDQLVISAHVSNVNEVEIKTYLDEIVIDYDLVNITSTPTRTPTNASPTPDCPLMTPTPRPTFTPTALPDTDCSGPSADVDLIDFWLYQSYSDEHKRELLDMRVIGSS
ncbi:MAG: hypothetical protein MUF87_18315, partial [Anaerolineae bacterium]|nr:hypothetical protein [Anaerolineae bacterium]